MKTLLPGAASLAIALLIVHPTALAKTVQGGEPTRLFRHVGTFDVMAGNGSNVAEIVDVTTNGSRRGNGGNALPQSGKLARSLQAQLEWFSKGFSEMETAIPSLALNPGFDK
jgi:hypothetical protein